MRILHIADLHLKLFGPRMAECRRIVDFIAGNVRSLKVDAIVIPGDLYDRRSIPEERLYLAEFLSSLIDSCRRVFAIPGNHDDKDDLRLFSAQYGFRAAYEIISEPAVRIFEDSAFAFLPWPNLAHLAAAAGAGASIAIRRELARTALLDVVRGFRLELESEPARPSLLIAHLPVTGASMDSGQPVSGGEEVSLSADELLESHAAGVALGHIHLRQAIGNLLSRPVYYAGAPFRCNFGESRGTKGGLVWTWDKKKKAWTVEAWDLPARPMVLLSAKWADGALTGFEEHEPLADAEVRLRIEFQPEDRDAVRARADELKAALSAEGAFSVSVEERPLLIARTRCAEVAAARTTAEKLAVWAQASGVEAGLPGALSKLSVLEPEVQP